MSRQYRLLGLLAFGDTLRTGARNAVAALCRAGVRTLLVSGDNARASRHVPVEADIDSVNSELLPQEKAALIRNLQQKGHNVAMVGDGINDAPSLLSSW